MPVKGSLLKRTQNRAKRLGMDVSSNYTRKEAKNVKYMLSAMKSQRKGPNPASAGQGPTDAQKRVTTGGKGAQPIGMSGINRVTKGRGSERQGQQYNVAYDADKMSWVHKYKGGKKKYLSDKVAAAYGYTRGRTS